MKPLPNYCLEVNDAVIVVQSCDDRSANIGVQWHGKITYYNVALPSLEREWKKWYYSDVRPEIFDMVLRENKSRLLEFGCASGVGQRPAPPPLTQAVGQTPCSTERYLK